MSETLSPPETPLSPPETLPDVFPILVTGDVVVDHHIYEGERMTAAAYNRRGFKVKREHGGAAGLYKLLKAMREAAIKSRKEEKADAEDAVAKARNDLLEAERQRKGDDSIKRARDALTKASDRLAEIRPAPEENCALAFARSLPNLDSQPEGNHAFATWSPYPKDPKRVRKKGGQIKQKVWRVSQLLGYGDSTGGAGITAAPQFHSPPESTDARGGLLVLDDAGFAFRHHQMKDYWSLPIIHDVGGSPAEDDYSLPKWLLLKMSGPLCQGDLWPIVSSSFGDRLICVVSADDVRKECVSLSTGLSWERTVEDIRFALYGNPVLNPLLTRPRHLIVTFSEDGALWVDNTDRDCPRATLVFDAGGAETEWRHEFEGDAFGYLSCMMAAITRAIVAHSNSPNFAPALAAGLATMRNLREIGHGIIDEDTPNGFPTERLAKAILKGDGDFSFSRVPWTKSEQELYDAAGATGRIWRIVEMSQTPFPGRALPSLLGLARQVVLQGKSAIQRLPHASFGKLLTADRLEIEALRTIQSAMLSYKDARGVKKPLSIGVFGPPGAGKSFGVQQIADDVFGDDAWLSFNLSQFKDSTDLIGAFHQVRDKVLTGITPVVFWDEFDSKEYDWLQYLLAPMQDGRFQDGQLNHGIGKCVFIFAGGTSHTFEDFGPAKSERKARRTYQLRKGPDFHSRLDAFYNVLGPNQRLKRVSSGSPPSEHEVEDPSDVCAPLRRALLIRALLKVPENARLDFDPELLDALLRVPRYEHGARSLEKLVLSLQPASGDDPIRRSSLPPITQIAMHVREDETRPDLCFNALLNSNIGYRMSESISPIAEAIHKDWRTQASPEHKLNRPWSELTPAEQDDNRAAARRIPEVLALAGLGIVEQALAPSVVAGSPPGEDVVDRQIRHHLERLAEAEHLGWMDHRIKNGWTYDPDRNDDQKKHPLLKPYAELPDHEKNKDRGQVRSYRKNLADAGYEIVFVSATLPESKQPAM